MRDKACDGLLCPKLPPKGHQEKGISPIIVHTQTLKHMEGKQDGQGLPPASLQEESFAIAALSHLLNYCSLPRSSSFRSRLHTPTSLSKDLTLCPLPQNPLTDNCPHSPPSHSRTASLPPPAPKHSLLSLVLPLSSCSPRAPARRRNALHSSFQAKWSLDLSGRKG